MAMTLEQERITSLRRVIKEKQQALGLEASLLELKGLRKFGSLANYSYPQSIYKYNYFQAIDSDHDFKASYRENITIGKHRHLYDKLMAEVLKKIQFDVCPTPDCPAEEVIEAVNRYAKEETFFMTDLDLEVASSIERDFIQSIFKERGKKTISQVLKWTLKTEEDIDPVYTTFEMAIPSRLVNSWISRRTGQKAVIYDLAQDLAKSTVLKLVVDFLYQSPENFTLIMDKLDEVMEFKRYAVEECSKECFLSLFNGPLTKTSDFYRSLVVLTLEEMIQDKVEITNLEKRLNALSSDYAKTYMTKKNIPLKIQEFMKDNHFLAMFGEVEADELCDLDKLKQLANEFITLSQRLYLPQAKDHSLRFRRLGHHKAAGIYYPGFNTLAVDIDSPHSFVHEMFHLIDFENGLLSANRDFRSLLQRYRSLLDEAVEALGEEDSIYQKWFNGKSKYSRHYYTSSEEAFARMGELYVTHVLKIDTSFNKQDCSQTFNHYVYPTDEDFLAEIKVYFDGLFERLTHQHERVIFSPNLKTLNPLDFALDVGKAKVKWASDTSVDNVIPDAGKETTKTIPSAMFVEKPLVMAMCQPTSKKKGKLKTEAPIVQEELVVYQFALDL